jgi:hypothetical protein
MKTPKLIYIAGPYRGWPDSDHPFIFWVARYGFYPVCLHLNSNPRPYFTTAQDREFWLASTLELMRRCDAVFFMPDWKLSEGARAEHEEAKRLGMKIFYSLDELKTETWEE